MGGESFPGVGVVRFRHVAIVCSCGQACGSDAELTDEQVAAVERDPVVGLRLVPLADAIAMAKFYREHQKPGHEPGPALIGALPE